MNRTLIANGFVAVQFVLFAVLLAIMLATPRESSTLMLLVGLALCAAGAAVLALSLGAHRRVNRGGLNVSPMPREGAGLVSVGIYARIRHPIYMAVFMVAFGAALVHGNPWLLALAAVLVGFFTVKSLFEERLLKERYPTYTSYMQTAGRFWPKL
jgi:protein-S-isoprenylcysteine O-methyltransferase Ste14